MCFSPDFFCTKVIKIRTFSARDSVYVVASNSFVTQLTFFDIYISNLVCTYTKIKLTTNESLIFYIYIYTHNTIFSLR